MCHGEDVRKERTDRSGCGCCIEHVLKQAGPTVLQSEREFEVPLSGDITGLTEDARQQAVDIMQRGLFGIVVLQVAFLIHCAELVFTHAVMDGDLVVGDVHLGSIAGLNLEISLADNVACLSRVGSQVGFVDRNIVTLSILDPHRVGGGLQKFLPLVRSEFYGIDWPGTRREIVVLSFQVFV